MVYVFVVRKKFVSPSLVLNLALPLLAIAINFFHGHISSSLTNASDLRTVDMPNNNFSGVVPSSIGRLAKLSKLNLEMNNLQAYTKHDWEFMISLANCTELQGL
jgi:hypothetical protein